MQNVEHYLGNPLLKKSNVPVEWTKEQILNIRSVWKIPYTSSRIISKLYLLMKDFVPFEMYDFQEDIVDTIHDNRFTICKMPRQSGKSTTMVSYILHYVLFNPNMNVAILTTSFDCTRYSW